MTARFQLRRFGRDPEAELRVENAKPTTLDQLRSDVYAAGERCRMARARGWIDERQKRLDDHGHDSVNTNEDLE